MNIYRRIWTQHFGPIPKDEDGRSYEIHHIDGNRKNNDISNLVCITIQEHYNIHYSQNDWAACLRISQRMSISAEEKSNLAKLVQTKRLEDGTHPFLDKENHKRWNKEKIQNGTHNFLGGEVQRKRIEEGTHHFLGSNINNKRVEEGIHPFLGGEIQRQSNKKRVENGTHHLLGGEMNRKRFKDGTHPFLKKKECPHCLNYLDPGNFAKHHGDKCKMKIRS